MMSCREVAKLLMSDEIHTVGIWTKVQARFHLSMCSRCWRLARQIKQFRLAARGSYSAVDAEQGARNIEKRICSKLVLRDR